MSRPLPMPPQKSNPTPFAAVHQAKPAQRQSKKGNPPTQVTQTHLIFSFLPGRDNLPITSRFSPSLHLVPLNTHFVFPTRSSVTIQNSPLGFALTSSCALPRREHATWTVVLFW